MAGKVVDRESDGMAAASAFLRGDAPPAAPKPPAKPAAAPVTDPPGDAPAGDAPSGADAEGGGAPPVSGVEPSAESAGPPAGDAPSGTQVPGDGAPESNPPAESANRGNEDERLELEALRNAARANPAFAEAYGRARLGLPPVEPAPAAPGKPPKPFVAAKNDPAFKAELKRLLDEDKDEDALLAVYERASGDALETFRAEDRARRVNDKKLEDRAVEIDQLMRTSTDWPKIEPLMTAKYRALSETSIGRAAYEISPLEVYKLVRADLAKPADPVREAAERANAARKRTGAPAAAPAGSARTAAPAGGRSTPPPQKDELVESFQRYAKEHKRIIP